MKYKQTNNPDHIKSKLIANTILNTETGCWEWTRYCNKKNGYGLFWAGRKEDGGYVWKNAHRASYELFHGPVPEGMEVAHTCHNAKCCNPNHLVAATHQDNVRMSVDAGRWAVGSRHGNAKLNETMVKVIKEGSIFMHLSHREVANLFEVSIQTIRKVLYGMNWNHVTVEGV